MIRNLTFILQLSGWSLLNTQPTPKPPSLCEKKRSLNPELLGEVQVGYIATPNYDL